jgi:putative sterol carrier protein
MAHEIFTDAWAQAWCEKINQNQNYRESSGDWIWPLILKISGMSGTAIEEDRYVYVDLKNGECLTGRAANESDIESTPYVVTADAKTWKQIFSGDMDIMTGIMWGKIKLEKGDLGEIAQHVSSAKQLVLSAGKVETQFPENI